jgi:hypothetical protein
MASIERQVRSKRLANQNNCKPANRKGGDLTCHSFNSTLASKKGGTVKCLQKINKEEDYGKGN